MNSTVFFRLLAYKDRESVLQEAILRLREGIPLPDVTTTADPYSFRQVPGAPFTYVIGNSLRNLFSRFRQTQREQIAVSEGLNTTDNERFLRLWWEVSPDMAGRHHRWVPLAKGGEYAVFYSDLHLLVDWAQDGESLKELVRAIYGSETKRIYGQAYYFKPGVTYSQRTQKGLSFRCFPSGSIHNVKGPGIFAENTDVLATLLGVLNSVCYRGLVEIQTAFGSYNVGYLQRTPLPELSGPESKRLGETAIEAFKQRRQLETVSETSHSFQYPWPMGSESKDISHAGKRWNTFVSSTEQIIRRLQTEIDDLACQLYQFSADDRKAVESVLAERASATELQLTNDDEILDHSGPEGSDSLVYMVCDWISYGIGCAFGRLDVRYATTERESLELPAPFDALPVCSPGMLQGLDGLPLGETPADYPLRIDWDGILVDDPNHTDDIVQRVREVLEVIWKDRAEVIEKEARDILGVLELRDFFRKASKGGFWEHHVSRYSKSRRKAPIYWLLQSSKKNYAIWLYYHRLDKDLLFKILMTYVEPKIRLENNRLETLRVQMAAVGESGKEAKRLAAEVERQEDFVSELRDFEDKLRRAANHHLEPDLNDGVVLNIAPLHELVPWKEAKNYWDELLDGRYEWSSIGKQLRQKGLVK